MNPPRLLATLAALLPAAASAELASGPVTGELQGYLESRHHLFFGLDEGFDALSPVLPDGYHPDQRYGAVERLRPTLKLRVGEGATLVATAEAQTTHGFFDRRQDELEDVVAVERLYFTASLDDWDHTAGKQNIAWGSGLLLNPTDLFNEKNPADLQAERPGVWALRSLWAITDASNLTLVAATPEAPCCDVTAIARWDITLDLTDLAVEAAWENAREAAVVGVDLRSELEVGVWVEAATTIPKDAPDQAKTSLEAGLDYSFDVLQTLFLAAEYMFQQGGRDEPGDLLSKTSLLAASRQSGADPASGLAGAFADRPMFLGKHYAVGLVRLEISSEWRAQALNVTHLGDLTGMVVPQISYLPAEAWTFTLGAQLTYGEEGGEYTLTLPRLTSFEETAVKLQSPQLGPALISLQGARVIPAASVFLWGRHAF